MPDVINRADGTVLGQITDREIILMREALVDEFEGDRDYNLRPATLDLFEAPDWLRQAVMINGSLEIGIESFEGDQEFKGHLKTPGGVPLAGLRVDLFQDEEYLHTAFSRSDGSFTLPFRTGTCTFRVTARGTLILDTFEDTLEKPIDISVDVVEGKILALEGGPVAGASVNLFSWNYLDSGVAAPEHCSSWTTTDEEGNFYLPVRFTEEGEVECSLEVFSRFGEPLGDYLNAQVDLNADPWDFHLIEVPGPSENWPPTDLEVVEGAVVPVDAG